MKKFMFLALMIGALGFHSCGSDDDGNQNQNECQTCDLELLGIVISSEYCDNGDGTMTVTSEGQEETVDLEGLSFDAFISALEQIGATCN